MTTYNTGNPVGADGSADPRDLNDNAQNIDVWVNTPSKDKHPDRLGVQRVALHRIESASGEFGDAVERAREAASSAESSSLLTQALAGFLGRWSDLSGAAVRPASVYHDESVWILQRDLTAIENHQPTDSGATWLRYDTGASEYVGELELLPEGGDQDQFGNTQYYLANGRTWTPGTADKIEELVKLLGQDFFPETDTPWPGDFITIDGQPFAIGDSWGIDFAQDADHVYMLVGYKIPDQAQDKAIAVLSRATLALLDTIDLAALGVSGQAKYMEVDADYIYLAGSASTGRFCVLISKADYTIARSFEPSGNPSGLALTTKFIVIYNSSIYAMVFYDKATFAQEYSSPIKSFAGGLVAEGDTVYAADLSSVIVFDTNLIPSDPKVQTIPVTNARRVAYDADNIYTLSGDTSSNFSPCRFVTIKKSDFSLTQSLLTSVTYGAGLAVAGGYVVNTPMGAVLDPQTNELLSGSINERVTFAVDGQIPKQVFESDGRLLLTYDDRSKNSLVALDAIIQPNPDVDRVTMPDLLADDARYRWYVRAVLTGYVRK